MIRRLLVTLTLVVGGTAVLTAGTDFSAARAYAARRCTATSGVVVAVDFGAWGGPTVRACASTPTTGLQALHQGGFSTTGTAHDGPGFVCRIASGSFRGGSALPSTTQQACVRTPPSSAYWSYWHAGRAQDSWHYSLLGASSSSPAPGSVDAWTFGAGKPPQVAPSALRATGGAAPARSSTVAPPTPAPTSRATPTTRSHPPTASVATIRVQPRPGRRSGVPPRRALRTGQAAATTSAVTTSVATPPAATGTADRPSAQASLPSTAGATAGLTAGPKTSAASAPRTTSPTIDTPTTDPSSQPTASATTRGPVTTPRPTTAPPTSPSTLSTTSAATGTSSTAGPSTPAIIDASSTSSAAHSDGSPWPAVLGGALVVLLAAGAALTFWRRRQLG